MFQTFFFLVLPDVVYPTQHHRTLYRYSTVCPRSLDPLHMVSYNTKWVKISWTYIENLKIVLKWNLWLKEKFTKYSFFNILLPSTPIVRMYFFVKPQIQKSVQFAHIKVVITLELGQQKLLQILVINIEGSHIYV